jgi:hypothetical protein
VPEVEASGLAASEVRAFCCHAFLDSWGCWAIERSWICLSGVTFLSGFSWLRRVVVRD